MLSPGVQFQASWCVQQDGQAAQGGTAAGGHHKQRRQPCTGSGTGSIKAGERSCCSEAGVQPSAGTHAFLNSSASVAALRCCLLCCARWSLVLSDAARQVVFHTASSRHAPHMSCCCVPVQGCTAIICMPVNTPEIKVNNVKRLGGQVELVGESYQETQSYAQVGTGRDHRLCPCESCWCCA